MCDCTQHTADRRVLFAGGSPWVGNWQPDIARRNRSIAYVDLSHHPHIMQSEFHGWLERSTTDHSNTKDNTKGNTNYSNTKYRDSAGVATDGDSKDWDLAEYDAIELVLGKSDGKIYTIALDDDKGAPWEAKFRYENDKGLTTSGTRVIRFSSLKPRSQDANAEPLDLGKIRKIELAFPSMNGKQEGPFSLSIHSINAVKLPCSCETRPDSKLDGPTKVWEYVWEKVKYNALELAFRLRLKKPKAKLRKKRFFRRPSGPSPS